MRNKSITYVLSGHSQNRRRGHEPDMLQCWVTLSKSMYAVFLLTAVSGLLQFGHPGCIETHGHTGGSSCISHLSYHAGPLFLVLFIPGGAEKTCYCGSPCEERCGRFIAQKSTHTARCRWFRWAHTLCSRSPPWRSRLQRTTSLRSWPGSLNSSPGETLWRVTTCNKVHSAPLTPPRCCFLWLMLNKISARVPWLFLSVWI